MSDIPSPEEMNRMLLTDAEEGALSSDDAIAFLLVQANHKISVINAITKTITTLGLLTLFAYAITVFWG